MRMSNSDPVFYASCIWDCSRTSTHLILFFYEMTYKISIAMSRAVDILLMPVVLLVVLDLWFYPDACRNAFVSNFQLEGNDSQLNERPVTRHMLSCSQS